VLFETEGALFVFVNEVEISTNCLRSEAVTFISRVIPLLIFVFMKTNLHEGKKVNTILDLLNARFVSH